MSLKRPILMLSATALYAVLAATRSSAQTNDLPQGTQRQEPAELEEIVVTATKRSESLQDVPLAVSALTNRRLQEMGADQFEDYARTIPSLSFVDNGPSKGKVVIRGVTGGVGPDASETTGIYFDEIPVGSSGRTPDLKLVDVERVEVLRGPQGTLYGSGSMGGTLRVITNKPDLHAFHADLETTYSNTDKGGDNWAASGALNVPLLDEKLAMRAVGYYRNYTGFIDNPTLGLKNINDESTWGGRIAFRWQATDATSLTLNVYKQNAQHDSRNDFSPARGDLVQDQTILEPLEDDFTVYNLLVSTGFDWAVLDSSTSYFERSLDERRDLTAQFGGAVGFLDDRYADQRYAQELRLTSQGESRFHWIVGAFFDDTKSGSPQFAQVDFVPGIPTVLFDAPVAQEHNTQYALFGESNYDLTSKLRATIGLRLFRIEQNQHVLSRATDFQPADINLRGSSNEDGLSPKFLLSYKSRQGWLLYASAAKGFRQGGPTGVGVNNPAIPTSFDSDSLWNYELGQKLELLDRRITINGALYYVDWRDMQTTISYINPNDPSDPLNGLQYVTNAGSSSIRGVEFELGLRPLGGLSITLTGSWLDPQIEENQPPPNDGLKGMRIPGVPQKTYSASLHYAYPITANYQGFIHGDYQYVGDSRTGFRTAFGSTLPPDVQPSYKLVNLRTGLEIGRYQFALFVDNLTDERPVLLLDRSFFDTRVHTARPRTYGLTAHVTF